MSGALQHSKKLFAAAVTDTTTTEPFYVGGSTGHFALTNATLSGASANITITYSLSNSRDGTFATPTDAITIADLSSAITNDTITFSPKLNRFMKIIVTKNSGTVSFNANLTFTERA